MIGVVNYGLGNVAALLNIYRRLEIPAASVEMASDLPGIDKIILPGVGAFDWAMSRLRGSGMMAALEKRVLAEGAPLLGICVGMQMLATSSEEGRCSGLNWIPGRVRKFGGGNSLMPLPHMGWNDARACPGERLFDELEPVPSFYFLHSYYFEPEAKGDVISTTDYGVTFASTVRRGQIYGVQFHPEKSHEYGVRLLKNFAEM